MGGSEPDYTRYKASQILVIFLGKPLEGRSNHPQVWRQGRPTTGPLQRHFDGLTALNDTLCRYPAPLLIRRSKACDLVMRLTGIVLDI